MKGKLVLIGLDVLFKLPADDLEIDSRRYPKEVTGMWTYFTHITQSWGLTNSMEVIWTIAGGFYFLNEIHCYL